jgi:hypothetical protein
MKNPSSDQLLDIVERLYQLAHSTDVVLGYCRLRARACYHSRQPWAMVTSVALG